MILLGPGIILHLIAIFLNILLFAAICFKLIDPALPFSESFNSVQNGGWTAIPMMFVLAVLAASIISVPPSGSGIPGSTWLSAWQQSPTLSCGEKRLI